MVTRARRSRSASRKADIEARYDAAGLGRRLKAWLPPASGPQRMLEGYERLRSRAQDAYRNDWAAASSVQKWTTNLVGVGIQPRWENDAHRAIWDEFVPMADADGVSTAYGLQALQATSWMMGGEVFLRARWRRPGSPLKFPLQVQLIESNFVPMCDFDSEPRMPVGHTVRQGIERNKYGQRTAYWMYREHPGDPSPNQTPVAPDLLIRVPASEVRHVFEPTRPGQLRGVSPLASILARLRSTMDFEDAVLERQKLANMFVAFIKRTMPQGLEDLEIDPQTGMPKIWGEDGRAINGLQPGLLQELLPGEDVVFGNPPEAGTAYSDYLRSSNLGTSAGQGLPYELMSGDIREISDRTLRIVIQEFRRFCEQRQWLTLIPLGCQPMVDWLAEAAVMAGRLAPSEVDAFKKCEWSPHGWEYIHPVQDVDAAIKARDAGLTSTSRIIAKRGDDPKIILAERQKDEASGLTPKPKPAPGAAAPADPAAARAAAAVAQLADMQMSMLAQPRAEVDPYEHFIAGLTSLGAQVSQVASSVAALAARPVENHVHVPQQTTPVVNVAPAQVDVHVPEGPAPVVNVAPAQVDVHVPEGPAPVVQNVVNVEPATVEVDVNLPARQTVSDIVRDQSGDITQVTQTERTIQ